MRLEKVDLDSAALAEYVALRAKANDVEPGAGPSADEQRADARRPDAPATLYLLRDGAGKAAAFGWLRTPLRDHRDHAEVWLGVDPVLRRFGVGAEMLELLEAEARRAKRRYITSFVTYVEGRVDAGVTFADDHGFDAAEQLGVYRAPLAAVAAAAPTQTGEYRIVTVVDAPDDGLLEARARLQERFAHDLPEAGVDRAQAWDAARVRENFVSDSSDGGHLVEALALTSDGEPVGFCDVIVRDVPLAHQRDTYVAPEHRGHGLGLALQAAAAAAIGERFDHVRALRTVVATANEPMRRVNAACGYEQTAIRFDLIKNLDAPRVRRRWFQRG